MSLVATDVRKHFGSAEVIRGINLEIQEGEFVSLVGKSGSGKSTLLYILSSLDFASSGTVRIDDANIHEMSAKDLHGFRNRHMGFVFQFHYLLPEFTALENVLMPALKAGMVAEKRPHAVRLLERFGLTDHQHHLPAQMSGGQMQRVAIARALVMEPRYIFADEPTGALDSSNVAVISDIFRQINAGMGTTIICVTHDPDFARLAPRQIHLVDGRIEGTNSGRVR